MAAQRQASAKPDRQLSESLSHALDTHMPNSLDARVELHVDKESGLVVGRVVDRRTNEEIRQLPPEAMVRLVAELKKELGPLVDIKA